jgi:AcrR family transcriptional regulator
MTAVVEEARPRPRRTQAERSEQMRRRIVEAAADEMREVGYARFRTAAVATRAGVSRGAQLHHFPTKDELIFATLSHVFQAALEKTERRAKRLKRGEDALEQIIADAREFFFGQDFFLTLDIVMAASTDRRFRRRVLDLARATRLPAERAWLAALVETGMPEQQAEDLLWLTLSIVRGLAIRTLWQNEPKRFDRLFALWRDIAGQVTTSGQNSRRAAKRR